MKIGTMVSSDRLDPRKSAARAERDGFDGIRTGEVGHDPFLTLGLAATACERVGRGRA